MYIYYVKRSQSENAVYSNYMAFWKVNYSDSKKPGVTSRMEKEERSEG